MPKDNTYEDILKIFEKVKGSYNFRGKKFINKGSVIKHMDGKCNATYTQDKPQYIGRYRCQKCKKSTKGILVDSVGIDSLTEYLDKDFVKEISLTKSTPKKPMTKESFDQKYFNSDDFVTNGDRKEYDRCLSESYDENNHIYSTKNLDRAMRLMPRYNIFQAYLERQKLGYDSETGVTDKASGDKSREMLLFALSERGLLDKAKQYEVSVKNFVNISDKNTVPDKNPDKNTNLDKNLVENGKESPKIATVTESVKDLSKTKTSENLTNEPKPDRKTDKTKELDEIEIQRLALLEGINKDRKAKQDKTKIVDKDTTKEPDKVAPTLDFMQFLSPDNLGAVIGKAEMDIINLIRTKKFDKTVLNGEMLKNCKESWKILIGWIQWKYGDEWMEHIPLVVFALNQTTTIAKALTED